MFTLIWMRKRLQLFELVNTYFISGNKQRMMALSYVVATSCSLYSEAINAKLAKISI